MEIVLSEYNNTEEMRGAVELLIEKREKYLMMAEAIWTVLKALDE